ncbi:PAS domain S-box protein [Desertifilum sp. FACHB-1129]|nr:MULTISPECIES: ATP-binding protein [Desertifilum]MBD2314004.1 PAS domain S-box protein [Desertifilum sp. FACHB-1129]MBD2320330.1 PAS domain S-box protein [Desertifilum sp. FACHB-866]MBD2330458.1 PAS domain S-box protein [Desertifilum sp. FACHB-868]MDA0211369.1 ATP-binding protein [Cyanobacteria bacterium FC1]
MRTFQLSSLRSKLIVSFLSVALLPLLIVSAINQQAMQQALIASANQSLLATASQTALSIDAFIANNLNAVRVESQLPLVIRYLNSSVEDRNRQRADAEAVLRALNRKDTLNIISYSLITLDGITVLDTNIGEIGSDRSHQDYFQRPISSGLPFVSPVRYSAQTMSIHFSSPVRNAFGEITGVLALRYNANALQRLINQNTQIFGRRDAFAILLDENYVRLAHGYSTNSILKSLVPLPTLKREQLQAEGRLRPGSSEEASTNLPQFQAGLERMATLPFFQTHIADSRELKAAAATRLETMPWVVVFVQSRSSFLAPIRAQFYQTLGLGLAIALAVLAVAVAMGQWLAQPLLHLTSIMTRFTAGNLKARAQVASQDETGILAACFNTMANQLEKLVQGLEERTRELEVSQAVTVAVSELSRSLLDSRKLLQDAISTMQALFDLKDVQIYLFDRATQTLQAFSPDSQTPVNPTRIEIESDMSLVAQAARTRLLKSRSLKQPKQFYQPEGGYSQERSQVAVPLTIGGKLLGVLDIQDRTSQRFSESDLETFKTLAAQIAIALENARLFDEIQQAESRFRTIFEDAPIGMALVNLEDGKIFQANLAFSRMLDYSPEDLIQYSFVDLTYPDDIDNERFILNQLISGEIDKYHIEKRYITRTQDILWGNLTVSLITEKERENPYCLGMIENITKRKQTEAALQESETQYREKAQELEATLNELQKTQTQLIQTEKMSSLGQLVAGVAHEINNPVNFIYGNITPASEYLQEMIGLLQLYEQHYPQPIPEIVERIEEIDLCFLIDDFQKVLASMKVGAERIQKIVLSLRNFSRLDEAAMKPVDIHEGIDNSLVILQNKLKDKPGHPEIKVIKDYEKLPLVECYAGQLNQVFMNLLTNSIDALEETFQLNSEQKPTIWIQTRSINSTEIQIQIRDNGKGMSEAIRNKIFDPFFTTKSVGKGTGLGLAISYQIVVEKHRGQLTCHSTPGKGSTFTIQIPIKSVLTLPSSP